MENKDYKTSYAKKLFLSLLAGYLITLVGIMILALILLLFQATEDMVNIGIIMIYILSSAGAGIFAGKQFKNRKFIWGMVTGILYFLFLVLATVFSKHSFTSHGQELITTFLLCLGGGTLGGMIS